MRTLVKKSTVELVPKGKSRTTTKNLKNKQTAPKTDPSIDEVPTITNLLSLETPLNCNSCSSNFPDHLSLAYHSKKHTKRFTCHICDFECKLKYQIRRHLNTHSGYECRICEKRFKRSTTALLHSYTHREEKKFECQACGSSYTSPQQLSAHNYKVHKRKLLAKTPVSYECQKCSKSYASKQTLQRHFSSNHREMGVDLSLICEVCGKRMETKASYKIHVRMHTGQRPYKCSFCGKGFAAKCRLTTHVRVHTGEKPYVCSFCGKKFGQHAPYWYHLRTHTNERRHVCKVCGKKFISQSNMNVHIKTCFVVQKD